MLKTIGTYGAVAGALVGVPLFGLTVALAGHPPLSHGVLIGYLTMLVALTAVFAGIKRHRDRALGGVIRFWPALALGLCISFIASLCYVLAWEAALAVAHIDFAADYARLLIAQQQAQGVRGEALARLVAEMDAFKTRYANPAYRVAMTFSEIFPVGVLVSLVSAAVLRNPRVLPARRR